MLALFICAFQIKVMVHSIIPHLTKCVHALQNKQSKNLILMQDSTCLSLDKQKAVIKLPKYQIFPNIKTCAVPHLWILFKERVQITTLTQRSSTSSLSLSFSLHFHILAVFHYHYYHHSQPLYTTSDLFTLFNRLATLHHTAANPPFTDRNMKRAEALCT